MQKTSPRSHWHEVRLIHDHQLIVLVKHGLFEWDWRLVDALAVIKNSLTPNEAFVIGKLPAVIISNIATRHASAPGLFGHHRETNRQVGT